MLRVYSITMIQNISSSFQIIPSRAIIHSHQILIHQVTPCHSDCMQGGLYSLQPYKSNFSNTLSFSESFVQFKKSFYVDFWHHRNLKSNNLQIFLNFWTFSEFQQLRMLFQADFLLSAFKSVLKKFILVPQLPGRYILHPQS